MWLNLFINKTKMRTTTLAYMGFRDILVPS